MQILTTERLRLEPLMRYHADALFEFFQEPGLYEWIKDEAPTSIEKFRENCKFLEGHLSPDKTEYWLNWIPFEKTTDQIIGKIEITLYKASLHVNLAYFIFKKYQKLGYAKEACEIVVGHMFNHWHAKKIIIEMDTRNLASICLAESLGAKKIGFKKNAEFFKGSWSDEFHYEILRGMNG